MATLSTTLSKASPTRYTQSGTQIQRRDNPYPTYGAQGQRSTGSSGAQNLFAALAQSQQFQRPQPSTQFQASYNFDPVLSKLSALGEMSIANARSEAANLKKKALIESGAADIATETGADPNTVEAARGNTLSTQALLQRDFGQRQRDLDEYLNQQGLFYSGERVRQMGEMEFGRAQAEKEFGGNLRAALAAIDDQLRAAEQAEIMRQIEAQAAAAAAVPDFGFGGGFSSPGVPTAPPAPAVAPLAPPAPAGGYMGIPSLEGGTVAPWSPGPRYPFTIDDATKQELMLALGAGTPYNRKVAF